jgi:transcriptional regulator with XRE-family HTH domain
MKNVGEIIRLKRALMGLSQGELAEKAGKRQATISEIEAGKRQGELPTLAAIAKALKIPLSEIVEDLQTNEGTKGSTMNEESSTYPRDNREDFFNHMQLLYKTGTEQQKAEIEKAIHAIYKDRADYWLNILKNK